PASHYQLKRVVAGAGIVGQHVSRLRIRIREEIHRAVQAVILVIVCQFSGLAGLEIIEYIFIGKRTALKQLRKNGELLAPGNAGIIVGLKSSIPRQGEIAITLGAEEIGKEPVFPDLHLVKIEGAVRPNHVIADIPRLDDRAFELVLDAE